MEIKQETQTTEMRFSKEALCESKRYAECVDLLQALLGETKTYTIKEVDKAIQEYKKREV